jgi:iron(III) transport system permease protein
VFRAFAAEPALVLVTAVLATGVLIFIFLPIAAVLARSLGWGTPEGLTLGHFREFFSQSYYLRALRNSLITSIAATGIIMVLGLACALLVTRVRTAWTNVVRLISLLPLLAPPFIFSLALIILGGRRGFIATALDVEFSIYGWTGVILAQAIAFFPVGYMMCENVLAARGRSQEDAAADLGAGAWTVLRTITLPLAMPGVLKGALLVFVMCLADFANPMMIGRGLPFLATESYLLVVGQQKMELAAVLSVFLIVPALLVFVVHRYLLAERAYTTIGGMGAASEERPLPAAVLVPLGLLALLVVVVILSTFGVVVATAFTRVMGLDNAFTLEHFQSPVGWRTLEISLKVSLAAAFAAAIPGIVLAYLVARKPVPGRGLLEFLTLFGLMVPGTVVGIGYILAFHHPPLVLTGTTAILVISLVARYIGVSVQAGISRLQQIDRSLEEASLDCGATPATTFLRVVAPLLGSAFLVGLVYTFMSSMITISSLIFLIAPGTRLTAIYVLGLAEQGEYGLAAALSVVLICIVLTCTLLMRLLARGFGDRALGA